MKLKNESFQNYSSNGCQILLTGESQENEQNLVQHFINEINYLKKLVENCRLEILMEKTQNLLL
jgi:hypothetical protein